MGKSLERRTLSVEEKCKALRKSLAKLGSAICNRQENYFLSPRITAVAAILTFILLGYEPLVRAAQTKQSGNFNSFADWCLNQDSLSEQTRYTVQVLLVRVAETSDCQEANKILTRLTELELGSNQISDIKPLSSLTNLTSLHLYNNQISDIRPLSSLTNLTSLHLYNAQISDISPLSSLTNLTELKLSENQISDIRPLSTLTNLTSLHFFNNQISDIRPLSSLTNLTELGISSNQISDIRHLSFLTTLTNLTLDANQISNIEPLAKLTSLTSLALDANQISDITPLSPLTKLTRLSLQHNQISDITPLSPLTELTSLILDANQISDIRPLSNLTNLTQLGLQYNQISDIRSLSNLTNLTQLSLSSNQIKDISPLSSLTKLTFLTLQRNQIRDISALSSLTNLTLLLIGDNQITDIKPLSFLTKLNQIELLSNPIAEKACPVQPITICKFSDDGGELYKRAQEQYRQGQFQAALATFQKVLVIYQNASDRKRVVDVINQMGDTYSNLGQYAQALEFYQQALSICRESGDRDGEMSTLASLGSLYERLGQYQKALELLNPIFEALFVVYEEVPGALPVYSNSSEAYSSMLNTLASIHNKQGNFLEALKFAKLALASYRNYGQLGISEANALDTVGVAYFRSGQPERGLMFLQRALERMQKLNNQAGVGRVFNHIGELYFSQGDKQKALELYQQALPLRQAANDIAGQGETLNNLGLLYFNQNQYSEAEKALFDAIKILEALRPGLKDDEKIAIFETQTVTYRLLQKVLIAQNKYNEALEISDRARARAFVELLAQRFTASDDAQITPLTLAQIQRIAKEQNATLVEYSLVYDDFNVNGKQQPEESELYIWVIQPTGKITFRRTDLKPLWQQQKTSLSKIVGEARCFENDACRQNLTQGRGVGNIPEIRGGGLGVEFNNAPGQSAAASQGQQQNRQLKQLHQLLIEPIADILPKDPNNRVIFIPQSSLFLAPFPALQDEKGTYLIEKHTILSAPSIQVLDLTHQQRQKLSPSLKDALVVGNPTMPTIAEFGKPPEKLSPLPGAETEAKEIAQLLNTTPLIGNQATESVVVQKMLRARIIHLATHGSFDPERGIGSWIALAPDSPTSLSSITPPLTRGVGGVNNVTSPITPPLTRGAGGVPHVTLDLLQKSIFAPLTPQLWGEPDSKSPRIGGFRGRSRIYARDLLNKPIGNQLSAAAKNLTPQPHREQGKGEQDTPLLLGQGEGLNPRKGVGDGLLKAEEIVDLKLNAELVALSACDTAQGKITGDGVVGLSRALISAGVPSVLVSLWKVDDNATAFLMREFYQNWQKSGDKAQALRQAMLTTKQKYPHPTNWAAFTLIGEAE